MYCSMYLLSGAYFPPFKSALRFMLQHILSSVQHFLSKCFALSSLLHIFQGCLNGQDNSCLACRGQKKKCRRRMGETSCVCMTTLVVALGRSAARGNLSLTWWTEVKERKKRVRGCVEVQWLREGDLQRTRMIFGFPYLLFTVTWIF
jgi:hypothetical protein